MPRQRRSARTRPKARSAPTVTATLANGRARLSAGSFNWDADLPPILGGENLAPSPTAYLLGALAGCAVAFLRDTLAPQFGVEIDDVTAAASSVSDLRGLIGIDGAAPDLTDLKLDIKLVQPIAAGSRRRDAGGLDRALPDLPRAAQSEPDRSHDSRQLRAS